jgi:hypothetical protein
MTIGEQGWLGCICDECDGYVTEVYREGDAIRFVTHLGEVVESICESENFGRWIKYYSRGAHHAAYRRQCTIENLYSRGW